MYRFAYKTYHLPLRAPLRTAHGSWTGREGIIVRLEDGAGRVGFGEIAPLPWFGTETLAEAEEICRKFGATVTGDVLAVVPSRFGCVRFALAAARTEVERDLRARFGEAATGKTRPEAAFHPLTSRLPVAALLPAGREALAVLPAKLETGFVAFKWKVGVGDMADELGIFDDLLAALPAYARLRLDANGAWDRRQAAKWLARCAERPVEFVEQPAPPADEATLLGLAADYPVTLALDESVTGLDAARRWQGLGWRGVLVVKPALAGPLAELADWVRETKADIVLSSALETALGRAAILRAALGQPLTKRALGFGTGEIFGNRCWNGPIIGPLADASCVVANPGEEIWNALKT